VSAPVKTPDGQPFAEYVRRTLIDELKVAELLTDSAGLTVAGRLNKTEFSSNTGKWILDLTLSSSNGKAVTVNHMHESKTSFVGEKACALTAQAFSPAVQGLITKVVRSPEFSG
jgi:hypothetical protein